jgi:hypothetical protein
MFSRRSWSGLQLLRMAGALGAIGLFPFVNAATLEDNLGVVEATHEAAVASQRKIDNLARETQELQAKYRKLQNSTEYQQAYNAELQKLKDQQDRQLASIQQQINDARQRRQRLVQAIGDETTALEKIIAQDLPFHREARLAAIASIKQQLASENLPISIPSQALWDVYQAELDYGRTLEAYREPSASIVENNTGGDPQVNLLRIGRVALYYQTLDGKQSGYWKASEKKWVKLPEQYNDNIKAGLLVANRQMDPQLLQLPLTRSGLDP